MGASKLPGRVLAFLFTLLMFAYCWLVGLGLLALLGTELSDLRVALTAPVIGTCVSVLIVFPLSEAGVSIGSCAVPIAIALTVGSCVVLALRRPRVHAGTLAVAAVCVTGALLIAWPMFSFGFHWFANGNDDMTNYVLEAQDLLNRGLLSPIDFSGLLHGRDYASLLTTQTIGGSRPASGMLLAFAAPLTGHPPYEIFMSLIVTLNLCCACAVGALALQFARRWQAAVLAAALLLISPLASDAVLQQLLAQVWGLAVGAGLLALLMRPELHGGAGKTPRPGQAGAIAVLVAGLVLVYPELIPALGIAYLLYLVILARRKQVTITALARLWLVSIASVIIIINLYLPKEIDAFREQVAHGLGTELFPPLFGYIMVPTALPAIFGLQLLPPGVDAPYLDLTIILAIVASAALLVIVVVQARKASAAALVLLTEAVLGVLLALRNSDFGVLKLTWFVQPFLAAAVACLALRVGARRPVAGLTAGLIVAVAIAQLFTQQAYVRASRNPIDASNISAADVIPRFHMLAARSAPIVSVTANPVLINLEAASAEGHSVFFQSRDLFSSPVGSFAGLSSGKDRAEALDVVHSGPWRTRSFSLHDADGGQDRFTEDTRAIQALASGDCELTLPGPNGEPFNRYALPASSSDLLSMPCDKPRNLLAFVNSTLGEDFYLPFMRRNVSFYPLEPDPFFPGKKIVGFGRYALFAILGYTPGDRLQLEVTATIIHNGVNRIPPATVVGASRVPLGLEGRGSARVLSAPLTPQVIGGVPYLLLDMGVNGVLPPGERSGVQALYGNGIPVDSRFLTSYVRDISLVSAAQYAALRPPLALSSFPSSLGNPDLEYAGLYEDGWMGADAFARLAGGPAAELEVKGEVPAGAGKHLEVLINGHVVDSTPVLPGALDVRVPVAASRADRRVELRFAETIHLLAPDLRPAAARLTFFGLVDR